MTPSGATEGVSRGNQDQLLTVSDATRLRPGAYVDVGVDVESLARRKPIGIFDHFLVPREAQALRLLPAAEQASQFFAYWTLKVSYIKARGLGLVIPLDRFWFTIQANQQPRVEIDPLLDRGDAWLFAQLRPTPQHLAAVCVRRRRRTEVNVVLRWHHFR